MHIAKTSGTAINAGLLEAVAPKEAATGFDRVMFGAFDDFESLSADARRTIHQEPASLPPNADLVHGHFSLSSSALRYPRAQFITVLREPRVRLLSLWHFWRMQTEETMRGWGSWTDVVARSRLPMEVFLDDQVVAFQTDNMALRMLLWPHPLIPDGDFIEPRHDAALLQEAMRHLNRFDYVDVVENPALPRNLEAWLERPFNYQRLNETRIENASTETPFHRELSDHAFDRLDACTRLDDRLWQAIVMRQMPELDIDRLRNRTMIRAAARYAA